MIRLMIAVVRVSERSLSVEQMRKLLRVDPDQQQPSPGDGSQWTEEASHTPRALTEALAAA